MKKLLALLVTLFALSAAAGDFTYNGIAYTVIDETAKTCQTKSYNSVDLEGALNIPGVVSNLGNTYTVVKIGDASFRGCKKLTSVTFPESVSEIGKYAFCDCAALASVTMTGAVKLIDAFAFESCSELTEIILPDSVTELGASVFGHCTKLANIKLSESLTQIGLLAFSGCSSLKEISLPKSVENIGLQAFYRCHLEKIYSYNPVPPVGYMIASDLYPDTKCTLIVPAGCAPEYLRTNAWSGLYNTEEADLLNSGSDAFTEWLAYTLNDDRTCSVKKALDVVPGILSIPSSITRGGETYTVTALGSSAFSSCNGLREIKLPETVTEIGEYAFNYCYNLKQVALPKSVLSIDRYAFSSCKNLKQVVMPASIQTIGELAFAYSDKIREVYYDCEHPLEGDESLFADDVYANATLYMKESALQEAKNTMPWSKFLNLKAHDFAGIDNIVDDNDVSSKTEVYNLNGLKVGDCTDGLRPGLYIVRQGGKTTKIIVK